MRVYEFSKQYGIATKELLQELKNANIAANSHMSVLSDEALEFLSKKYSKTTKPQAEKKPAVTVAVKKSANGAGVVTTVKKKASVASKVTSKPAQQKKSFKKHRATQEPVVELPKELILEPASLSDVAMRTQQPVNDLILTLLRWGIPATKNQILPENLIERIAQHFDIPIVQPAGKTEKDLFEVDLEFADKDLKERTPVVVILGHVDHGKTTLLDFIRKTRVAAREKGGITQHLGAYEATTPHGNVVFLDTPGHAAFSKIRARGAKVADIAILIIAADDGIMPQTVEAIKHAKNMEVPIVVAVNKIDKVDASRVDRVKQQLSQHDILVEDWGGEVVLVPISAKEGTGVDQLLEILVLQAEMLELKAEMEGSGKGYVLESKLEKGRGPVATVIGRHGRIKVGDFFVCGKTTGKINSLVNSYGKRIKEVAPSIPVQVAGFSELPEAGDFFEVVPKEVHRKARGTSTVKQQSSAQQQVTTEKNINIIVKTDTHSSQEALVDSINKLSKKLEKGFSIVHAGVGGVSESDVMLASDTGSSIFTLHVKPESNAVTLAQRNNVKIDTFTIIYKLLEHLEDIAEKAKEVKMVRTKIGQAEVRKIFSIKNVGVIAGCYVQDGRFAREGIVVALRDGQKLGEGKIKSLQRDKKTVKEVHAGYECAFLIDSVDEWQEGDIAECYIEVAEK